MAANQPLSRQANQKQRNLERIQELKELLERKKAERDDIQEHTPRQALQQP
jgi:hypothetical protein